MTSEAQGRLTDVRAAMAAQELEALLVDEPGNRRWLTGFTGSAGTVIVSADDAWLHTDSRYYEQVERQSPEFELVRAGTAPLESLCALLEDNSLKRVGIEAETVTVGRLERMRSQAPDIDWVSTSGIVERFRAIKTEAEIDAIARCAALGDDVMRLAYDLARPGMTESELGWQLEKYMREHGAQGLAFPTIVGAGPNGALPHHATGDRPIGVGEPIVIDLGAAMGGYNGDLTRTFSLGPASDPDYEAVWSIVAEANQAAANGIRPGVTGAEADALARDVITAAGYGEAFGHGLGHGVGINVHEMPRLGPAASDAPLREGMVLTIEPGIYLPGRFGVRIEDLAVLRADGVEILSRVEKTPVVETAP
ncbi:MAG: M24 family metallopeptidase [Anaerolineae bacterium]